VSSKKGTFWLDGDLYVEAMPAELRKLPNYSIGMTAPAQAKLRAKYDRRIPYAFSPNTRVRDDGSVQLKGPARARKLACGNYPPSANAPIPTNCAPSEQCACASTVVIPRHEAARERQLHPFGSTRWSEIYGMRSAVESDNAQLKIWRGSIRRHSTHVFGTTANALLLALHCAAVNVSMLHDAYDGAVTINSTSSARVPTKRQRPEARAALHRQRRPGKTRPPARGTNGHQRPAR
jgi:hypothetical protein